MARTILQEKYEKEVIPALQQERGVKNRYAVPRLVKIVVNTGLKEAVQDKKVVDAAVREIAAITGQRPVVTRAKKAISNFKLREGMPIGCCVTLRRDRMYDFLQRLIDVALPRVRDFKGVSKGFDQHGNYTMGLTEQGIFPEIDLDKSQYTYGMNITLVTTASTNAEGKRLLELLGVPFRK